MAPAVLHAPDQVVVVGTVEPAPLDRLAGDVVVIDGDALRASTADSVEDLLRREAGLQVSRNGGPGANATVLIRGANAANTLVLVDGVRIGSASLGLAEFESLSLAAIERIEVLRGPGSSLYGADGSGGVVNIVTRRGGATPRVGAWLAAGQYGAAELALHSSARVGAVDLAGSLSHERAEGVSAVRPGDAWGTYNPDRDGFERTTAQAQVGWAPAAGHRVGASVLRSKLDARYDSAEYPPPDYAPDPSADYRNQFTQTVAALDYRAAWSPVWTSVLRYAEQEGDLYSGGPVIDRFLTRRKQADAQLTWRPVPGQQLTAAVSTVDERASLPSYDARRDNRAFTLAYLGETAGLRWQADARHDDNSDYGRVTTGRLGASYPVAEGWRVRGLVGTAFRAPSFNETDYPYYGVPGLKPERGRSLEVGVVGRAGGLDLAATAWRNRVRDLIGYTPDPAQCPDSPDYAFGCAANIADARLQGVTTSAATTWGAWHWRAQLDFLDAKDADTGERLPRRAAHQISLSADYTWGDWRLGAAVLQVGARPNGTSDGYQLPETTTLDLKARWQFARDWSLETKVLNATDERLEPARDYQGLGRQLWIGVRYVLGGV